MNDTLFQQQISRFRIPLFIFLAVLSVLFFTGWSDNQPPRSIKELWNFGHLIYYSLLPLLLISIPRISALQPRQQVMFIFFITTGLGLAVELLQNGTSRSPDVGDIFRNMIGACIAVLFLLPVRKSIPNFARKTCQAVILILISLQFVPPGRVLIDEYHARTRFPVLADFETQLQLTRWGGSASRSITKEPGNPQNSVMAVGFTTQKYSGVYLEYFPGNWQGYTTLNFRVLNTSDKELSVHCRVHDRQHSRSPDKKYADRFNTSFLLHSGWNIINIDLDDIQNGPRERQINLGEIQSAGIFVISQPEPLTIYIDDVILK